MGGREKGVATTACPTCGTDQPLAEQADGSMAATSCSKCFPAASSEKAAKTVQREQGTPAAKSQED